MKYCISIDWFQYFCHRTLKTRLVVGTYFRGATKNRHGRFMTYYIGKAEEFHSMYREAFTIYIDNQAKEFVPWEPKPGSDGFEDAMQHVDENSYTGRKLSMVHVYATPKMSSIDQNSVSVKVANRLLYKEDWSWYLHDIIEALNLTIKNITRIDMCLDFQRFAYSNFVNADGMTIPKKYEPRDLKTKMEFEQLGFIERYMTPSEFIHHYIQDQTVATTETFVREGSNVYCVYGKKKMIADDGRKEIDDSTPVSIKSEFEYIRFGSRNSGVCTYLYNKSQELRDKKSKPWIRQRWEEAGLNEKHGDIFRLEFSINAKGMCLKRADRARGMKSPTAKTFRKISRDDVETQRSLETLFVGYCDKYFSFRLAGKQKYRKDMKRITLFDYDIEPTLLPCYYNTQPSVGRAERNAGLTLKKLQWSIQDLPTKQADILYQAQQVLESLSVQIRELKDHEIKETLYLTAPYKKDEIMLDPLVKQAVTEVEAIKTIVNEQLNDLAQIDLLNDSDEKEWWLSDEDGLIAYS